MKNTLTDLNNHLFMQLERLNEEKLSGEQLTQEIERSKAINSVSGKIIENARLVLDAEIARQEHCIDKLEPKRLAAK